VTQVGHKPPDQAPKRDQKTKTRTPPNRTSTNQADPGSEIVNGGFPHGATLNKVNPNEDATDGQNPNGVVPYEEIINKYVSRIVELVTPRWVGWLAGNTAAWAGAPASYVAINTACHVAVLSGWVTAASMPALLCQQLHGGGLEVCSVGIVCSTRRSSSPFAMC
jgi:hypothetical protein